MKVIKDIKSLYRPAVLATLILSLSVLFGCQAADKAIVSNEEEQALLDLTMKEIQSDVTVDQTKIQSVEVVHSKAGIPPFNYDIAVNMKDGTQILYSWSDEKMTDVKRNN